MGETKQLRVLYICYLSLEDPLVRTQVVAYLKGLAELGHIIHLITFDEPLEPGRRQSIEADLRSRGIVWHSLRYHKRPSLPATVFDTLAGAVAAVRLTRRHRLDAIHARSHVPASMALIVRRLTGCRTIFDVRGLMAEEYVDAGRWKKGGLPYRIAKWVQRLALERADAVVTLTEAVQPHLAIEPGAADAFVIPCCVDLERIEARLGERERARAEIKAGDRPVMVYVGKFTGFYMEREMAECFAGARRSRPGLLFLIVTQADPNPMLRELRRCGVTAKDYRVLRSAPEEIGRWLAAAEFGISFVLPSFSKTASSPTKLGEYLAAGLPVLSTAGIGDVDTLLREDRAGVLIDAFTEATYEAAAKAIDELCSDPNTPQRCREAAHRHLSLREVGIPRYDELYRLVASGIRGRSR